ncbi:subtilisin-like protease 2 isoform X2 [Harmonia axyridis]|uniref:subtilisin-like protease 2 isoform X2 n=1 Tax=Harmonia axyridis TaxID=115357 RepID=UPI001E27671B|nr:subtilisin-like protease 2 isoform X2 [Harmonia axyridis]
MLPVGGKKGNLNSQLNDQIANEEPLRRSSRIKKRILAQNIEKSINDISKNTKEQLGNAEELQKKLINPPKLEFPEFKGINGSIDDRGISKKSNTTNKKCLGKVKNRKNDEKELRQEFHSSNSQQNHDVNNSKHIDQSPSINVDQPTAEVTADSTEQKKPSDKNLRSKKDKVNSQKNQCIPTKTRNKRTNMTKTDKKEQEGQSGMEIVEKCVVLPSTKKPSTNGLGYNNEDKNGKQTIPKSNFDNTGNAHNQQKAEISKLESFFEQLLQNKKKKESIKKSEKPKSLENKRIRNGNTTLGSIATNHEASEVENEKQTSSSLCEYNTTTTTLKEKSSSDNLETVRDEFGVLEKLPILDEQLQNRKNELNSQQKTEQYTINLRDIHLLRDSPEAENSFGTKIAEKVVNIDSQLVSSSRMKERRYDNEIVISPMPPKISNQYSRMDDKIEEFSDPSTYEFRKVDLLRSSIETYSFPVTCTICYEKFFFKKHVENHLRIHNILSCCCPLCVKEMDNFQRMKW